MARRVFYSFYWDDDSHRVAKVKSMGVIEGQPILTTNEWEDVKAGGVPAVKAWIDEQMAGKSCVVVLIGTNTAGRSWVEYEIEKAWSDGRGVFGVYIHNLMDLRKVQTPKGANPFSAYEVDGKSLANIVKTYDPPHVSSPDVYAYIKENLPAWVEEAIAIRSS